MGWQEGLKLTARSTTTVNAQRPGPLMLTFPTLEERQIVLLLVQVEYTPTRTLDPLEASQPHSVPQQALHSVSQQAPESYPDNTYEVEASSPGPSALISQVKETANY